MTDNHLVFYVKLHVKPERIQEWRQAFQEIAEAMSKEEAFIACYLHQDAHDENLFTLYERWAEPSVEAFLKNQMKPYRVEYDAKLSDLLQRPREPQVLLPLGQWLAGGANSIQADATSRRGVTQALGHNGKTHGIHGQKSRRITTAGNAQQRCIGT